MRIVDKDLLCEFARAPFCEWCKATNRTGLDPHHVFQRGIGGGHRLDVRINLVSLCRKCHDKYHTGQMKRDAMLAIAAKREGMTLAQANEEIYRLRRLIKGVDPNQNRMLPDPANRPGQEEDLLPGPDPDS